MARTNDTGRIGFSAAGKRDLITLMGESIRF
jgi:hypothetical protein